MQFFIVLSLLSLLVVVQAALPTLDFTCSSGSWGYHAPTFEYAVSAQSFMDAAGSFHNMGWYVGGATNNTGRDNTVGATRTGTFPGGGSFTERLDFYERVRSDSLNMIWTLTTPPFGITLMPSVGPISFTQYKEQFQIVSICRGTAVRVYFPTWWCTDKVNAAYDVSVRTKFALGQLSLDVEALRLPEGKCP